MTVRIAYVDESYDAQKFVLSAVCIRHDSWSACFDKVKAFRVQMKQQYGLHLRKEIHAAEFVAGRGHVSDNPIGKWKRSRIFHAILQMIPTLPDVMLFNVCLDVGNVHDVQMKAWDRLLNRLERTMLEFETRELPLRKSLLAKVRPHLSQSEIESLERRLLSYAPRTLIVADEGREADIRKVIRRMHVFNPIPSKFGVWQGTNQRTRNITTPRLLEDPVFKASHQSYFIQLADCVAFALLKREVATTPNVKKYGLHDMFEPTLGSICFRPAHPHDPLGIVRK